MRPNLFVGCDFALCFLSLEGTIYQPSLASVDGRSLMDKVDIYYFSGTGNSLVVARDIAEKLSGNILAIPSMMDQDTIQTAADMIGLVFPVYLGGVPRIVKRFLNKMSDLSSKYMFSVCTCRNTTGATFEILKRAVRSRGGKLSAGFAVKMPGSYIVEMEAIAEEEQQKLFGDWKNKLNVICEYVNMKREGGFEGFAETSDVLGNFILSSQLFNGLLSKLYQTRDKHFYVTDQCTGCATCSRVCPVGNIQMVDSKPQWLHHCEQCYACLQWCPREAIQYKIHPPFIRPGGVEANMTENRKRYHHPDVRVSELIVREKKV